MDIVRVLRVIEYVGSREDVERQINGSLHGTKQFGNGVTINIATVGCHPEILKIENKDGDV